MWEGGGWMGVGVPLCGCGRMVWMYHYGGGGLDWGGATVWGWGWMIQGVRMCHCGYMCVCVYMDICEHAYYY